MHEAYFVTTMVNYFHIAIICSSYFFSSGSASDQDIRVAIIGGGAAGLISAAYCRGNGFTCDVFEQAGQLGGTWVYTDRIGLDENGIPVLTSMYKGLRAIIPKEIMNFPGFPFPDQNNSYLYQPEILGYLHNYTDYFGLSPHIKYYSLVTDVDPIGNKWKITVQDTKIKVPKGYEYDVVMVCNGHFNEPVFPNIPGQATFKGAQFHSHDYRSPEPYRKKSVLAIGGGPSGQDISNQISGVTDRIFLSRRHHSVATHQMKLSPIITLKEEVLNISGNFVYFVDGSSEKIDVIIYCTGYKYNYPFLKNESGIQVKDNYYVYPLYKQIVNIEHPTMGIIGIPYGTAPFQLFDIQVRFFLSTINGHFQLPQKNNMLADLEKGENFRKSIGWPKKHAHKLGRYQENYYSDLAGTANIKEMPPVVCKIVIRITHNPDFSHHFTIIDNDNFIEFA